MVTYSCHHCKRETNREPPAEVRGLTDFVCDYCAQPLLIAKPADQGPRIQLCVSCLKPFVRDPRADGEYQRMREAMFVIDGQANVPMCDGCKASTIESRPPVRDVFESPNFLLRLEEKQKYQGE